MVLMRPDPRLQISLTFGVLAVAVIPLAALPALIHYANIPRPVIRVLWCVWAAVLTAIVAVYIPMFVRRMRYGVDHTHIQTEYGVFFRRQRRMPLDAVRHLSIVRGPVGRACGFCFVSFSAAGGKILLAGIPQNQAEEWMQRLANSGRR